jgi:hypothetical protein
MTLKEFEKAKVCDTEWGLAIWDPATDASTSYEERMKWFVHQQTEKLGVQDISNVLIDIEHPKRTEFYEALDEDAKMAYIYHLAELLWHSVDAIRYEADEAQVRNTDLIIEICEAMSCVNSLSMLIEVYRKNRS